MKLRHEDNYLVDASPVTAHLQRLNSVGLGCRQVSHRTGLDWRRLQYISQGKQPKIRACNAKKILAVPMPTNPLEEFSYDRLIPAIGTVRRLQGLQAMGYTNEMLSDESSLSKDAVLSLMNHSRELVKAGVAREVKAIFNRLQLLPAPDTVGSRRAKARAAKRGWRLPLQWDEDEIDTAEAKPYLPMVSRDDNWYETYEEMKYRGCTLQQIADHMDIKLASLKRRLERRRNCQVAA